MKENIETISKKVLECIKEKSKTKKLADAILKMVDKEHSNATGKNLLGLGDNWQCAGANWIYAECPEESNPNECKDKKFECKDLYLCGYYFTCDHQSKFQCADDQGFDFVCGDYSCEKKFNCDAGHIFTCSNEHSCNKFTCSAGGQSCKPPAGEYEGEPEPPGGGPTQPGDFICAYKKTGDFYCKKKFACKADDDFDCDSLSGYFECRYDFTCNAGDDFYCQSTFRCTTKDDFHNCPKPTDYTCGTIVTCGGAEPYVCPPITNFSCAKPHGGGAE